MKLYYKILTLMVLLCSSTIFSQATFNLNGSGGDWGNSTTWTLISGSDADGVPDADDTVRFTGTTDANLNITENVACKNFYNESTTSVSLNLNFSNNTTLAVSELFQITTTAGVSRTTNVNFASGATVAYLTVGTHIYSGTLNTASYTACANVLNLAGPDITVSGNVNIFNNTNGTIHMRSMISHSAGKLKLTGTVVRSSLTPVLGPTSGSGYLNTYQNNGNLSTNNKYQMSGTASLEFYHVGETPVYIQRTAENPPLFNGSTSTTVSYFENSTRPTSGSVIYGSTYSKLILNNDNGANKVNTLSATTSVDELTIVNGSINLTATLTITTNGKINISSSGRSDTANLNRCITGTTTFLVYAGFVDLTYSGNAKKPGIEIKTGNVNNTNGINNLVLDNTSNFDFGSGSIFYISGSSSNPSSTLKILQSINITDNSFTLNTTELICPSININGTTLILNSKLTSSASVNLNGLVTSNGTISAPIVSLDGDGSLYNSLITANNNLTISGATTIATDVNSPEIIVNVDAPTEFTGSLTGISLLTLNSNCIINSSQYISNTLTLGANLTNLSEISTEKLTITNDVILNPGDPATGTLKVLDLLSINSGAYLTTGGELILVSNSNNTARLASVHDNAIIGDVTVERYLNNLGRKWRLLTAPLKGTTNNTIFNNWQNNGDENARFLYGTDIWGPVDTYEYYTNGLDYIPLSTHNFRKYTNGVWSSISDSINEELFNSSRNNTFLTFIIAPAFAGVDKTNAPICDPTSNSSATTLLAKGELITGEQSYDVTGATYHLIGNPYASPIDFSEIIAENTNAIDAKIWILDPKIGTFGSYITWDPINDYNDVKSQNMLNGTTIIQSGQGFFVKRKTGNTSIPLVINENNKTSGNFNNVFGRSSNTIERIRVSVEKFEENSYEHKDACVVGFYEGASNAVTGSDVQKFTNAAETLAFVNGNTSLSSEHRLPVVNGDALFIRLTNGTVSNYKLKINTENFTFSGEAIFYDLKLGTSTIMPLDGSIFEYNFDVTSDPTTQGTRFKIVFNTTLSIDDNNIFTLKVYPNPSTVSQGITLNTGNLELGNYVYKIINVLGQEIQKGTIENTQKNQDIKIDFANNISSGWYTIQILNINKSIINSLPIILK